MVLISSSTTAITFVTLAFLPLILLCMYTVWGNVHLWSVLLKGPNEITTLLQKIYPLLIRAYKCYPILNVGGVCVRVLMYSEPLGNKQSRTWKLKQVKRLTPLVSRITFKNSFIAASSTSLLVVSELKIWRSSLPS